MFDLFLHGNTFTAGSCHSLSSIIAAKYSASDFFLTIKNIMNIRYFYIINNKQRYRCIIYDIKINCGGGIW